MKLIICAFILACFVNCDKKQTITIKKKDRIDKKIDDLNLELPMGEQKLIEYNFPKDWENLDEIDDSNPNFSIKKISKTGYDSIFYFIEKNTDNYYIFSKNFKLFKISYKIAKKRNRRACKTL